MNTTPLISERELSRTYPDVFETMPSYTTLGGSGRGRSSGISAVVLQRSSLQSRQLFFQNLDKEGFDRIISVEKPGAHYDTEELSQEFPFLRFILLKDDAALGRQINAAVQEIETPFFFVLWNDLEIIHSGGTPRMRELLFCDTDTQAGALSTAMATVTEPNAEGGATASALPCNIKRLCTVPVIQNGDFVTLPTITAPQFVKGAADALYFATVKEGVPSLFPFDAAGIYDRQRFLSLGGFDGRITSPHWQLLDFGFRAWLWGERIETTQFIRLCATRGDVTRETTRDESYRRFFLKNLCVKSAAVAGRGERSPDAGEALARRDDSSGIAKNAYIPLARYLPYMLRSGFRPVAAWREFMEARDWVAKNSLRFKRDASELAELWSEV